MGSVPKRKEIYKYEAPWTIYATSWSVRQDKKFRLAIGSFIEEYNNKVQVCSLRLFDYANENYIIIWWLLDDYSCRDNFLCMSKIPGHLKPTFLC